MDIGVVNEYLSGTFAGRADHEYVLELLFHKPFEVMVKIAIDRPYIVSSLMVCNKNVGCVFVDILSSYHLDSHECEPTYKLRPQMSRIIAPEVGACAESADHRDDSGDESHHNEYRGGYKPLIYSEKNFHESSISYEVVYTFYGLVDFYMYLNPNKEKV